VKYACKLLYHIVLYPLLPIILFAQGNYVFGPSIIVNDDTPGTRIRQTTQRAIACRGDTVYIVWDDNRFGNVTYQNDRVFFSKSTDAGSTWSVNKMISQDTADYPCGIPKMCLDGSGNIYVTYWGRDNNDNNADIYFVKSTDGGGTFTPPVIVNDSAEVHHQQWPAISVDSSGQYVYVVWQDWRNVQYEPDIYFSRSTDGGAVFLPAVRVNDDLDTANQWQPVIACDNTGQNIYIAWMDQRDTLHGWDVYFSRSTDYGQTFEANYPINDTATTAISDQFWPSIYWNSGIIYATWRDERDNHYIYAAKSNDNGASFGINIPVRDNPGGAASKPSLTVNDSCIYVVWYDTRDFTTYGYEIFFSFSSDSGQTFSEDVLVNDHQGEIDAWDEDPSVCVNDSGRVFAAWDSDRNDSGHLFRDIYVATGIYVGIEEYGEPEPILSLRCYPNPFRAKIDITYSLPRKNSSNKDGEMQIHIYDATGRCIKSLHTTLDGLHASVITWHGDDENGITMPGGVYFIEMESKKRHKAVKIR
jgi:hypothetical protein